MSGNTISLRHNFPAIAARLERLPDAIGNKAMVRALNKTIDQGKPEMARQISREFRLTVGQVKERLAVRKAVARGGVLRFEATLMATRPGKGRSMNLIAFVEKQVTLAQGRSRMRKGEGGSYALRNKATVQKALELRFQIKRSGGKKMIKGAFIGNDGRTVFIREGKARLPIKALNTIDVPQMFNTQRINSVVRATLLKRFEANFKRELRAVLQGWVK